MAERENNNGTLPDIRKTVVCKAEIGKVWETVATADGIAAWFMPPIDFQLIEGHSFQLNSGPFGMSPCTMLTVDPPNSLSFSWGKDWIVTFELKALGEHTEFTLIHGGWKAGGLTEFQQPHEEVRERMNQGWDGICNKLQAYVHA